MSQPSSLPPLPRVEVPLGSRVLVRSGLFLDRGSSQEAQRSAAALLEDLEQWQGTGTLIVAGGFLFDEAEDVDDVLNYYPLLKDALRRFSDTPGRSIHVLRSDRHEELLLACVTASGVHEILVTAQSSPSALPHESESADWLDGIDLLNDPADQRRFARSRALYRRLGSLLWIPPLLAILTALAANVTVLSNSLNHIARRGRPFTEVSELTWSQRLGAIIVIVVIVEVVAGVLAVILSRISFDHDDTNAGPQRGTVLIDDYMQGPGVLATMDLARAQLQVGRAGTIVGGPRLPSLTHLDAGFVAVAGVTSPLLHEHRGRFGLPPVFLVHRQDAAVLVETGANLHVQLLATDTQVESGHGFERLVAGPSIEPTPTKEIASRLIASWPLGDAWPPPVDLARARSRANRIRRLAALSIFLTGLFDLLIAVSPPLHRRLHAVLSVLPLGVSQTAATAVAIIGVCLVMLARGILRGQRRAWLVAVVLLAASTVFHLAHAISVGGIVISLGVLALLLVERRYFTATTDRTSFAKAIPTLVTIVLVAVLASFFAIEVSHRHHGQLPSWPLVLLAVTERLVGLSTIALPDRVDDFVYPTMFAVGIGVILATLYLITRPVVDRRLATNEHPGERRIAELRARDIVRRHGRGTLDYFALRDDKQFFFYGDSVVAYAVFGGIALVSPDPIGPVADRTQVWAAFRNYCDAHAWGVGVIGAGVEWLPIYSASTMRYLYLGDEAVVDIPRFTLQGGKMKGLRQACSRIERNGYRAEFFDPATIEPARIPALIELMGMNRRGEGERGFSMMLGRLFDPKDQGLLLCVVSDANGKPAAMCQFVPSPAINGYSLDLMRRDPGEHPNGLLDFALCSTIEHLKAQGAQGLSLNFSAFRSTLDGEKGDGITQRIERWGLRKMSSVLPIETLWKFNEKYQPNWLSRHLVYASPENFVAVAAAALRAESVTEIPVLGRFLAQDPVNRPGTVVPADVLAAAESASSDSTSDVSDS